MPSLNTGNAILSNPIKVDSSYNVGIGGAASGSFKLQVTGTTNLTGALTNKVTNISADGAGVVLQGYVDNTLRLAVRGSGYNDGGRGGLLASTGDFSSGLTATSSSFPLDIYGTTNNYGLRINNVQAATLFLYSSSTNANSRNWGLYTNSQVFGDFDIRQSNAINGDMTAGGNGTSRFYIKNDGNVVIGGTTSQNSTSGRGNLTINGTESILNLSTSDTNAGYLFHNATNMFLVNAKNGATIFSTNGNEKMRVTSGYSVSYRSNNASNATFDLDYEFSSPISARIRFATTTAFNQNEPGEISFWTRANDSQGGGSVTERMKISSSGAVSIVGSLSKGSGSFRIEHPLESLSATHDLVHSFVESPQANNIYRGKVQLENGLAQVNLDDVSTMTDGTFVVLNREIHTYTSNETDWDAVRGKVEGNILTIECQNNQSNAIVSWLVIGERHDKHMMDTAWTDNNGRVIVEPLKPIEEDNNNK